MRLELVLWSYSCPNWILISDLVTNTINESIPIIILDFKAKNSMLHHNAQIPCWLEHWTDFILLWIAGKLKHFLFNHYLAHHMCLSTVPCFHLYSRSSKRGPVKLSLLLSHHPCLSDCSPNGSNSKNPVYCSIFRWNKRGLITGLHCSSCVT